MKRLARMMIALYPARWRRRYGYEIQALIEDSDSGWLAVIDLAREAIKMQFRMLSLGALGVLAAGAVGLSGGGAIVLLLAMLGSMFSLLAAVAVFFKGERRLAVRILYRWSIGAGLYLAIVVVAAMLPHDGVLKTGTPYCEDDWCMSVEGVSRTPIQAGLAYRLDLRIFSRANQGPRSAKGASLYLTNERNRRFLPVPDPSAIPFDVDVAPGESVNTSLTFHVPADSGSLYFAGGMDHMRYAGFIIGSGDLLHKPLLKLRLQ